MKETGLPHSVDKQREIIALLTKHDIDVRTWEVLTLVAKFEGEGLHDMLPYTSLPKSSLGRFIQLMSNSTLPQRKVSEGMQDIAPDAETPKLLEAKVDPSDYRKKRIYLTTEGRKILAALTRILAA